MIIIIILLLCSSPCKLSPIDQGPMYKATKEEQNNAHVCRIRCGVAAQNASSLRNFVYGPPCLLLRL